MPPTTCHLADSNSPSNRERAHRLALAATEAINGGHDTDHLAGLWAAEEASAWATVGAAVRTLGRGREVKQRRLTEEECREEGLPLGSVEPCVYLHQVSGSDLARLDAWDDGDGCLHIDAFGWTVEVYHQARCMSH